MLPNHYCLTIGLLLVFSCNGYLRAAVTASAYLEGAIPQTFNALGTWSNTGADIGGAFSTTATMLQRGDWDLGIETSVTATNPFTHATYELHEASATISVNRIGHLARPSGAPYPTYLTFIGAVNGNVTVPTGGSYQDGSLQFGQFQFGLLEFYPDGLFFSDVGSYQPQFTIPTSIPVDPNTGEYTFNASLHSESWGRYQTTLGSFKNSMQVMSILLPDGHTPESQGWTLSFDDGSTSPNAVPGDYNQNGVVDAADYVVWRNGLGTTYTQSDYDVWRSHFGQTAGSGTAATAAVPEPRAIFLALTALAAIAKSRWKLFDVRSSRSSKCNETTQMAIA